MTKQPLILEQLEERIFLDANPLLIDTALDDPGPDIAQTESPQASDTGILTDPPDQQNEEETDQVSVAQIEDETENTSTPVSDNSTENTDNSETAITAVTNDENSQTGIGEDSGADQLVDNTSSDTPDDTESGGTQIIVVDSQVYNHETLIEEIRSTTSADSSDTEVLVIEEQESGIERVTSLLNEREDIQALHIFSYANDGTISLGTDELNSESLAGYDEQLQNWGNALDESGDILLYGCDIAQTEDGQDFVQQIAQYTGADVAASTDSTGNSSSGGDWELEYESGSIETASIFAQDDASGWLGVLDPVPTATVTMPAEGLIEENVDFTVSFTNGGPSGDVGYGPYMDVYVPAGLNVQSDPVYGNAGLTFQKFIWDDTTSTWNDGAGTIIAPGADNHPFDSLGGVIAVDSGVNSGDQWFVIELPFGSFTPEQPSADISFTAELDEDAVAGTDGVVDGSSAYAPGDAVVGEPLEVRARAGFRFGADALDNPTADPVIVQSGTATGTVTPQLVTITKSADVTEGQTVTGPNFPVTYTVVVDIAPDQTVESLTLTDYLPNSSYYRDDYDVTFGVTGVTVNTTDANYSIPISWQPNTAASGDNDFVLPFGTVTGSVTDGTPEITLTYSVYFGETDASSGEVVPSLSGDAQSALNESAATGQYTHPIDGPTPITAGDSNADDGTPGSLDPDGSDYQHEVNSITVEKNVDFALGGDTPVAGITPDDTLEYSIDFEISDYFGFQDIVVSDELGDGQHILDSFDPTLVIYENGSTSSYSWDLSTLSGAVGDDFTLVRGADGVTGISFNVSALMMSNGDQNGELLGDLFAGDTGTSTTDNGISSPGNGTRGTITFQTVIDEDYLDSTLGDVSVDARDPIVNSTTITGSVLSTTLDITDSSADPDDSNGYLPTGLDQSDDSSTVVTIEGIVTEKEIAYLNGAAYDPATSTITPGDIVTYRLRMDLPTGDVEDFMLTDYLPLPVYDVDEFGTNPDFSNSIVVGSAIDPSSIDLMTGGMIYWGTGTTLQNADNIIFIPPPGVNEWDPGVTTNPDANSLTINMGSFEADSNNGPWVVEILITATVQNTPFADALFLTNQATWEYNNTFDSSASSDQIDQIELSAPKVMITKGVVATDGGGEFDPTTLAKPTDVDFSDPGLANSLNISGAVDADEMFTNPIDGDLIDADGGDLVTFAVSAYNIGGSAAYDLQIRDTLAGTGFITPASLAAMNLQVWSGTGTRLDGSAYEARLNGGMLEIDFDHQNGVLDGDRRGNLPDGTVGDDVFIITYDLQVDNENAIDADIIEVGSDHTNTASIVYYTGQQVPLNDNGTPADPTDDFPEPAANWVDPNDPPSDQATVTIDEPTVSKELVRTVIDEGASGSGNDEPGVNENLEAVIGETVEYRIIVEVPEGETPSLSIIDRLDPGLGLVSVDDIIVDSSLSTSIAPSVSYSENSGSQDTLTIDFGNVTNLNTDDTATETITVEYTAVVLNNSNNQSTLIESGPNLNNTVQARWGTNDFVNQLVPTDTISVIEPTLEVLKSVSVNGGPSEPDQASGDSGDLVTYTFDIRHTPTSEANAFDVQLSDVLPASTLIDFSGVDFFTGVNVTVADSGASPLGTNDFRINNGTLQFALAGDTSADSIDLEWGRTITLSITGMLQTNQIVGNLIENDADLTWSSLTGPTSGNSDLSGFISNGDSERDGSGGINNYSDTDPADIIIGSNAIEKTLVDSEFTQPSDPSLINDSDQLNSRREVVIGEELTYQLVITLAEGLSQNLLITDTLDPGLSLVSIDRIDLSSLTDIDINSSNITALQAALPIDDPTDSTYVNYTHSATGGDTLGISLGAITNTNTENSTPETITIAYTVMVTDIVSNQGMGSGNQGTQLDNSAELTWGGSVGGSDTDNAINVEVIEPAIQVTKTDSLGGTGDAGDAVTYTIRIQHAPTSENEAFDLSLTDILPGQIDFSGINFTNGTNISVSDNGSAPLTSNDFRVDSGVLQFALAGILSADTIDMAFGREITIALTGTLVQGVQAGELINNEAAVNWSSINGDRSNHSGFVPGSAEDQERAYNTSVTNIITIATPSFEKVLTDPADTDATIGETVSYDLVVTVPEGTTNNVVLNDDLPDGMSFISASLITTDFSGSVAISGITPVATYGENGANLSIALGDVVATGSPGTADNQFIVRVVALVLDVPGNDGLLPGQTELVNDADMTYNTSTGTLVDESTDANLADSNPADNTVTVIEPELQMIKQVNGLADGTALIDADAGDAVTYTFTVTHTNNSTSAAYDLDVSDALPAEFNAASVSATINTAPIVSPPFEITGNQLTTNGPIDLQLDQTLVVTVVGTLLDSPTEAGETITNTGDLNWSSVSGDGTDSPFLDDGSDTERGDSADHTTGTYTDSDDAVITIATPSFEKVLTDPADTDATIGETVSYDLVVTVPEGTTNNVVLNDDLPDGMSFISASLITTDFSGSVAISGITPVATYGENGANLSIALGDVVATGSPGTADNQFIVRVVALVLDVPGNDGLLPGQTELVNDADMTYNTSTGTLVDESTDANLGDSNPADNTVTVIEPELQIEKNVDILGNNYGIAGDPVSYTLLVDHTTSSTSDAREVSISDVLPVEFTPTGFTAVLGATDIAANFSLASQNFTTLTPFTISQTQTLTIIINGTISSTVTSATFVDNQADLDWSSATGTGENSPYIGNPGDNFDNAIDSDREYTSSDDAEFSVPEFEKAIVATSLTDTGAGEYQTGNEDLTIGEIVTYHLTATVPNGSSVPVVISDSMPANLEIVSATVLSIGSDINNSTIAVGGSGIVTGSTVSFNFGTLTVADNDTVDEDANRIVVEIEAVVVNDLANNSDGDVKQNSASFAFGGPTALTDTVAVDLVEPEIDITKTFYDALNTGEVELVDAGDRVTIRIEVGNSGTAPVYDAMVSDILDPFFDPATATVVGTPTNGFVFNQSGASITFTGGTLQPGQTASLAFSVVVSQAVNPNTAVVNTATLTGDSLPAGHINNNNPTYDRPYSEASSDNLLTPNVSVTKAFVSTDNPDTPDTPGDGTPDLNIGESATFHFLVTLPEGTVPSLVFVDQLPEGMQFLDGTARLILNTASLGVTSPLGDVQFDGTINGSGGSTINNGDSFPASDLTSTSGDGNDVRIDFGEIVPSGMQGAENRQFIIELQAVVIDVTTNQSGTELVNTATVDVPNDGVDQSTSDPVLLEVVDPELNIVKRFYNASGTAEIETVPGGSTVTVSLSLINSGTGPSYDLEVQDPLDPTKFNIATIAPATTPAGYTFSLSGNTVIYRGDGAIMPAQTVTFTYTVQVFDGFRQADNTAMVTAGDTVPGESPYERDHDGARNTDTIYEFVEPQPPGTGKPPIPFPPVGITPDPADVGLQYLANQGSIVHGEIFPTPDPDETFLPPPVSVSPIYTGRAEPGTTIRVVLSDVMGNKVGYQTVMADTAGNWLAGFSGTLLYDMPHRMEITQTVSTLNNSTDGLFNFRSHFNPTMIGLISSSVELDVPSVSAYQAGVVLESIHQNNTELMSLGWDNFHGYEFFASSTNPSQNKR